MSETRALKNKRKYLRKQVTEVHNNSTSFSDLTVKERENLKLKLEAYLSDLNTLDDKLLLLLHAEWDTEEEENLLEGEVATCEFYKDKIYSCLTDLKHFSLLPSTLQPPPSIQPPSVLQSPRTLLKCPTATSSEVFG